MMLDFGEVIGVGKGMYFEVFVGLRDEAGEGLASKRLQDGVKPLLSRAGLKVGE